MLDTPEFDYIVVGAGTAGCVVASRLSETANCNIALIEAGGWGDPVIVGDPRRFRELWNGETDWGYSTEPDGSLASRRIPIPRGRLVGGSGSVNGMIHVRGSRRDYDLWGRLGNDGWAYKDVAPIFVAMEDFSGGASLFHGTGGPLSVRQLGQPDATITELTFLDSAYGLGFGEVGHDFNGQNLEGAGFHQAAIDPYGRRSSTAMAYLQPVLHRRNLQVLVSTRVTELTFTGDTVTGLKIVDAVGRLRKIKATREVILCAGAIESPRLLLSSGVGRSSYLESLGIRVRNDLPGVGEELQDHTLVGVAFACERRQDKYSIGATSIFWDTGLGARGGGPDLQIQFFPDSRLSTMNAGSTGRFSVVPTVVRPLSKGRVALRRVGEAFEASIESRLLEHPSDVAVLRAGIDRSLELANSKAFKRLGVSLIDRSLPSLPPNSQIDWIRQRAETSFHPVGTCRMGVDPDAVVDARGRVHGLGRIRIADASIMPAITAGNTNAPSIMIGEKISGFIRNGG